MQKDQRLVYLPPPPLATPTTHFNLFSHRNGSPQRLLLHSSSLVANIGAAILSLKYPYPAPRTRVRCTVGPRTTPLSQSQDKQREEKGKPKTTAPVSPKRPMASPQNVTDMQSSRMYSSKALRLCFCKEPAAFTARGIFGPILRLSGDYVSSSGIIERSGPRAPPIVSPAR